MLSPADALLAAIAAAPADDTPRLVFADWLDEHGEPIRAEFIRLQCLIAELEAGPREVMDRHIDEYVESWGRQQEILKTDEAQLVGGVPGLGRFGLRYERGFVREVTLTGREFVEAGGRLAGMRPLPRVAVTGVGWDSSDFLASPHLGCVTAIKGMGPYIEALEAEEPEPWFVPTAAFVALEVLDLEGSYLTDTELETLARCPLPALRELDLSHNYFGDAGLVSLLNSGLLLGLRRIALDGNDLTDQSAFELSDRLARSRVLEELSLRATAITGAGQRALRAAFGGRVTVF